MSIIELIVILFRITALGAFQLACQGFHEECSNTIRTLFLRIESDWRLAHSFLISRCNSFAASSVYL